jgi:hypothetical protein
LDNGVAMNPSEEGYGGSNIQPILTKPSDFLLKEPVKVTHFDNMFTNNLFTKQHVEVTHFDNLSNEEPIEINHYGNLFVKKPI